MPRVVRSSDHVTFYLVVDSKVLLQDLCGLFLCICLSLNYTNGMIPKELCLDQGEGGKPENPVV